MEQKLFKFKGATLDEAYRSMREKLGRDAVVLSTADVREGGLLGLLGQKTVEVTAALPEAVGRTSGPRAPTAVERRYAEHGGAARKVAETTPAGSDERVSETLAFFRKLVEEAQARAARQVKPAQPSQKVEPAGPGAVVPFKRRKEGTPRPVEAAARPVEDLRRGVEEMREMLDVLVAENTTGAGPHAEFAEHYRLLVEQGVSRKVAAAIVKEVVRGADRAALRDARVFRERLKFELRKQVNVTQGIRLTPGVRRVVALVGATGVGKTTNVAKLAAEYAVRERVDVALITSDTYRIAATEQLRVYANIIGLPMRVVNDPAEMAEAVAEFDDRDLVLIDTAGGSQFNTAQIGELQATLAAAHPDEVYLLVSANTQLHEMHNMIENFRALEPTALFFTKLDETRQYGAMFSAYRACGLPLSYFSTGQDVPNDIELASSGKVAHLIIESGENRDRSSSKSA